MIKAQHRSLQAVVVTRGDETIFEYYRDGTGPNDLHPVMSITKSVISTLTGIALGQGAFTSLDQRIGDLLPEALDPGMDVRVREMTIRHLLTMSSGFDPDGSPMGTAAPSAFWRWSLRRPVLHAPGERFNYDNQASHLLSVLLTRAVKQDATRFASEQLFEPLGIRNYVWPLDSEGHLQGALGLSLSASDMAKIGILYLRGGRWKGRQLLPEVYITEATRAHNKGGPPVRAADYGYLWWITRPPQETLAYLAAGSGGQLIYVVPGEDLVIAVAGNASAGSGRRLVNQVILPALQTRTAP